MNNNLIVRFRYEHLRNEVHVEYNETIDVLIVKHNPLTLGISPQYVPYKAAIDVEVGALNIIKKSGYTDEISAQDNVRDRIFRGLVDAVQSSRNHFNSNKRRAAEKINIVLEHYGNIAARTFDQGTAAIDDLLREFNDNHVDNVQLLSLTDWLTQLDAENQKFKQLMSKRYAEVAKRPATNMRTARTETDKALRAMLNMLDALITVNGADMYMPFINELNAVSERYKNQLAQASGRRKKAS
jgi:hypothetical protein